MKHWTCPLTYFEEFHDGVTRSEGKFRLKLITHDGIFYSELDQSVMATHRSLRSWKLCSHFKYQVDAFIHVKLFIRMVKLN